MALLEPIITVAAHKGLRGYIVLFIQSFMASGAALTLRDTSSRYFKLAFKFS